MDYEKPKAEAGAEMAEVDREIAGLRSKLGVLEARREALSNLVGTYNRLSQLRTVTGTVTASAGPAFVKGTLTVVSPTQSLTELAAQVLREAGKPMHIKQIVRGIQAKGVRTDQTYDSLRASLVSSIHRLADRGEMFRRKGQGVYALIDWPEDQSYLIVMDK